MLETPCAGEPQGRLEPEGVLGFEDDAEPVAGKFGQRQPELFRAMDPVQPEQGAPCDERHRGYGSVECDYGVAA